MKPSSLTTTTIALVAGSAAAQSVSVQPSLRPSLAPAGQAVIDDVDCVAVGAAAVPGCAQECFMDGAAALGCRMHDLGCQCQQQARMMAAAESCVADFCPAVAYQSVIDGVMASKFCDVPSPKTWCDDMTNADHAVDSVRLRCRRRYGSAVSNPHGLVHRHRHGRFEHDCRRAGFGCIALVYRPRPVVAVGCGCGGGRSERGASPTETRAWRRWQPTAFGGHASHATRAPAGPRHRPDETRRGRLRTTPGHAPVARSQPRGVCRRCARRGALPVSDTPPDTRFTAGRGLGAAGSPLTHWSADWELGISSPGGVNKSAISASAVFTHDDTKGSPPG